MSLNVFIHGTTPWEGPFVPLMCAPRPRTGVQSTASPPAHLANWACPWMPEPKMPSRLSSTVDRKQLALWGWAVPTLKSVGVEGQYRRRLIWS
jgi:hypothetical protein